MAYVGLDCIQWSFLCGSWVVVWRIEKVGDLLLVSIKCGFMKYSILLIIMMFQWHVSALD